jgi:glycosyltransferase involved in cell wall biosynthesis
MKKPVIVTDTGDMGTLLRKHPAGLVVPPENPEALCNAMQEMEGSFLQKYNSGIKELSNLFNIEQSAVQWLNTVISD